MGPCDLLIIAELLAISDGSVSALFISEGYTLPEDDTSQAKVISYDRYGMDNEDWRHLDDYWRAMYGDVYPREGEWKRGGVLTDAELTVPEARPPGKLKIFRRENEEE